MVMCVGQYVSRHRILSKMAKGASNEAPHFVYLTVSLCRSQWPRGLRLRSAAARLLRSWVRIPPGAWMFVCCECCVLSGRGLCDELITRPEEFYWLWCVAVCDLETSRMGAPYIYIYDISSLKVNNLTLILLTWRKWWAPNNASRQQMGFNSGFKVLNNNRSLKLLKRQTVI